MLCFGGLGLVLDWRDLPASLGPAEGWFGAKIKPSLRERRLRSKVSHHGLRCQVRDNFASAAEQASGCPAGCRSALSLLHLLHLLDLL